VPITKINKDQAWWLQDPLGYIISEHNNRKNNMCFKSYNEMMKEQERRNTKSNIVLDTDQTETAIKLIEEELESLNSRIEYRTRSIASEGEDLNKMLREKCNLEHLLEPLKKKKS
jgi:hypothetical protein